MRKGALYTSLVAIALLGAADGCVKKDVEHSSGKDVEHSSGVGKNVELPMPADCEKVKDIRFVRGYSYSMLHQVLCEGENGLSLYSRDCLGPWTRITVKDSYQGGQ